MAHVRNKHFLYCPDAAFHPDAKGSELIDRIKTPQDTRLPKFGGVVPAECFTDNHGVGVTLQWFHIFLSPKSKTTPCFSGRRIRAIPLDERQFPTAETKGRDV